MVFLRVIWKHNKKIAKRHCVFFSGANFISIYNIGNLKYIVDSALFTFACASDLYFLTFQSSCLVLEEL